MISSWFRKAPPSCSDGLLRRMWTVKFCYQGGGGAEKHAEARQRNESHTSPVSSAAKKKRIFCAIFTLSDWWLQERKLLRLCSLAVHLSCLHEVEKVNTFSHGAYWACVIMSLPINSLELPALTFRIFLDALKLHDLKIQKEKVVDDVVPDFPVVYFCNVDYKSNTIPRVATGKSTMLLVY